MEKCSKISIVAQTDSKQIKYYMIITNTDHTPLSTKTTINSTLLTSSLQRNLWLIPADQTWLTTLQQSPLLTETQQNTNMINIVLTVSMYYPTENITKVKKVAEQRGLEQ